MRSTGTRVLYGVFNNMASGLLLIQGLLFNTRRFNKVILRGQHIHRGVCADRVHGKNSHALSDNSLLEFLQKFPYLHNYVNVHVV